ncbi:MAG: hypothetical protein M1831_007011 [Alyxoria varia]|nr:MAG: hypothetical protein M1831_007011 [Alyxoria varia]
MTTVESRSPTEGLHLCVFVHGLWGSPSHLNFLCKSLRKQHPSEDKVHTLICQSNAGSFTYDGIETGGERVTKEVEDELESLEKKGKKVTKFSILGYSLGGLIARYAIGLLYSKGHFDDGKMLPVNFTTFATPHLGVRTPLRGWRNSIFNSLGGRTLSLSGHQMFLIDNFRDTGEPLLSVLAGPNTIFMHALSMFKKRSLYANIVNDRAVAFYTAAMSRVDPFVDIDAIKINYAPGYEDVILESPPHMAEPRREPPTIVENVKNGLRNAAKKAPFVFFLVVFAPIGGLVFLTNSGVQSFKSARRIKDHREGKAGIGAGAYSSIPLMIEQAQKKAEGIFEAAHARKSGQEYLLENEEEGNDKGRRRESDLPSPTSGKFTSASPPPSSNTRNQKNDEKGPSQPNATTDPSSPSSSSSSSSPSPLKPSHTDDAAFPTLALTPAQFSMIANLDALGFSKHPVHIHRANHSHAAIVVRMKRPGFGEGEVVARHWTERWEL